MSTRPIVGDKLPPCRQISTGHYSALYELTMHGKRIVNSCLQKLYSSLNVLWYIKAVHKLEGRCLTDKCSMMREPYTGKCGENNK